MRTKNSQHGNKQWNERRKQYALEKEKNLPTEVDDFYKEEELKKEDGYEMETIIPEEIELPTPHYEDQTFEVLNETVATEIIEPENYSGKANHTNGVD
jgi:hypothetical protein